MLARADAARDAGRFRDAAVLYDEVLRLLPGDASIHVQCGHMYKEAGDLSNAEAHYVEASRLIPEDADLALQMGHFHKVAGQLDRAGAAYRNALRLSPGWADPTRELDALYAVGWRGETEGARTPDVAEPPDLADAIDGAARARDAERLVPELTPRRQEDLYHRHDETVDVRRLGRPEPHGGEMVRTLRGIEAVRGFCVSLVPIVEVQIELNEQLIHRGPVMGGYALAFERDQDDLRKYVFNIWLDLSGFAQGRYVLDVRCIDARQRARVSRDRVVIAPPLTEAEWPGSDAVISVPPADEVRSLDESINARPSIVRAARRTMFEEPPRTILVQRTDQLGDMVASIPAMRRLRSLAPQARIVGLLTAANADLARTLGLFDEVIVIDFPDDKLERRRLMPLATQKALREKLESYKFDVAIDLAEASVSRPLLLLSGARYLFGVGGFPWLTISFDYTTRDVRNQLDIVPHSTKILALVEAIGAAMSVNVGVVRRDDLDRDVLARFGLAAGDDFAVLHTGARLAFSRWPHYAQLARRVLDETGLKVVMLADEPSVRAALPSELVGNDRFTLLDQRLAFDEFDALMSFCAIFVGNDSGPKHLAALRGSKVVSLHTARINWAEWGQEITGSIMSRKVPCSGCAIFHDPEECGKDFACIRHITADEVFAECRRQLA